MTSYIDRRAEMRTDEGALARELGHPEARWTAVWRGRSLVDAAGAVWLESGPPEGSTVVYLGRDRRGRPRFAVDLGEEEEPQLGLEARFVDLRRAGMKLPREDFEMLAYARGMVSWHQSSRCCERCGSGEVRVAAAGFERICRSCETKAFPRTDPAVMMLVTDGDRCLLARQAGFPPGMFSALAGFVEPGESLEECVRRETMEEVGLQVGPPRYFASQPWPFPRSLMVGFFAEAQSRQLRVDETELEEARWFTRAELQEPEGFFIPPPISLAHHLIRGWLEM